MTIPILWPRRWRQLQGFGLVNEAEQQSGGTYLFDDLSRIGGFP
jgi:hypothetical protein